MYIMSIAVLKIKIRIDLPSKEFNFKVMKFFRPQGAEKDKPDRLFVVTARHKAMILEAEGGAGHNLEIVTKVSKVPIDVYYSYVF